MTNNIVNIGMNELELNDLISGIISRVKSEPGNVDSRLQLFKLYSLNAEWDRALQQLNTVQKISPESKHQVELFKNLLLSEHLREQILRGEREACSLDGVIPEWMKLLQYTNACYHTGDYVKGEELRLKALANAPSNEGKCDALGTFSWLADADDRLGPVCEFIYAGGYRWVPFTEIKALIIEPPKGLIDIVWAKATITLDKPIHGFIPARYPVTLADDQNVKTGLFTNWRKQGKGRFTGLGRKMWVSSTGECSIFEAGHIIFNSDGK